MTLVNNNSVDSISSIDTIYTLDEKIQIIIKLYETYGNSCYFGEDVSKTDHMIQAAVHAQNNNEEEFIILAVYYTISVIFWKKII